MEDKKQQPKRSPFEIVSGVFVDVRAAAHYCPDRVRLEQEARNKPRSGDNRK
jgi:hypothetical protein